MKRIHIVGRQNHGKTRLTVELIRELTQRGYRTGSVKHSSHVHELDTPGKDSFRHRQAGANPAAIVTTELIGLYLPITDDTDFYARLAVFYADCDLVLVEGNIDHQGVKIEVWREEVGGDCLASQRKDILAVVTDDQPDVDVPLWPRSDVSALADKVVDRLLGQNS